jgi:Amt family ammonium transporter
MVFSFEKDYLVNLLTKYNGDVVTAADAALALAKENGRDRIVVYQAEGAEEQRRRGEVLWASRIREALDADRLRLYCQPMLPLDGPVDGRWGCEVLVRMLDEHDRLIPPMAFLPAAERYDLMPQVDRWVINAVIEHWRSQPQTFGQIDKCNINLSGQSLAHRGFLEFVLDAFERSGFPPSMACFEITETAVIADMANAQRLIRELSARGCRFALDDFGSGFSSFAYLKQLPVDIVKIDGAFIQNLATSTEDQLFVKALTDVAKGLGKVTVAEFVENADTLRLLDEFGVDFAQGYHIGRPAPEMPGFR